MGPEQIMLLLGLAVILIIVLAALIGFAVGFKKELGWTAVLLVLLGVIWIGCGNIDAVLTSDIPESIISSVNSKFNLTSDANNLIGLIMDVIETNVPELDGLLVEGTHAYGTIYGVISCILRAALLIGGTIGVLLLIPLIRLLVMIIKLVIKLIILVFKLFFGLFRVIFRIKRKEKRVRPVPAPEPVDDRVLVTSDIDSRINEVTVHVSKVEAQPRKKSKKRLWGAGLGAAKAMLFLTLIFVPISGIISIASSVSADSVKTINGLMNGNQSSQKVDQTNSMIDDVFEYVDAYENSFIGKLMNSSEYFFEDDLSNMAFENLLTIKGNDTIVLPEEIITYINVLNALAPAYQNGTFDIWAYAESHPEEVAYAFELLKSTKLVVEIIPVGIEFASNLPQVQDLLNKAGVDKEVLLQLADINWRQDWETIIDALHYALELGNFTDADFNFLTLEAESLKNVLTTIGSAHFLKEVMPVVIEIALSLDMVTDLIGDKDINISVEGMDWSKELGNFGDIYGAFRKLGITSLDNLDALALVDEILSDSAKTEAVLEILAYLVGVQESGNSVVELDINLFANILLPIAEAVLDQQLKVNSLEMFSGIISLTFAQYPDQSAKELWYQDLKTIVYMAQSAVKLNALSMDPAQMNLTDFESIKNIVAGIFDIKLLSGNVEYNNIMQDVKSALLTAAIEKFGFLDEGTPWEEVVWEDEKTNFLKIIDILEEIVALGEEIEADLAEKAKDPTSGVTAEDVVNPIDLKNLAFDANLLLTWQRDGENGIPFVDLALSIFEVFLDDPESNLFLLAIPNVANKYIIPILDEAEGEGEHLPIFDNLTKEELKNEFRNLLDALSSVAKLKITSTTPEFWAEVNRVHTTVDAEGNKVETTETVYALYDILDRIINSKLLKFEATEERPEPEDYRGRVIRIIMKIAMGIEIGVHDLDSTRIGGLVDYEGDLAHLKELVDTLLDSIRPAGISLSGEAVEEGVLHDILFDENGVLTINLDTIAVDILESEKVLVIVDALQTIFGVYDYNHSSNNTSALTLLSQIFPAVYYSLVQPALPEEYSDLLDIKHSTINPNGQLTGIHVFSDISKFIYMLEEAINMGAVEFLETDDLPLVGENVYTKEHLKNILNTLAELHILGFNLETADPATRQASQDMFGELIDEVLSIMGLEIEHDAITKEAFKDLISHLTSDAVYENGELVNSGILDRIFIVLEDLEIYSIKDLMNFMSSATMMDDLLTRLDNDTLHVIVGIVEEIGNMDLIQAFLPGVFDYAIGSLGDSFDLSFLEGKMEKDELVRVAHILDVIVDLNVLGVLKDNKLSALNRDEIATLLDAINALSIFDGLGNDWLRFAVETANDMLALELDLTDYAIDVDWQADKELLVAIIDDIFKLLDIVGIDELDQISDVIANLDVMSLVTEENAQLLVDLLEKVVNLDSIHTVLPLSLQIVAAMYEDLAFLSLTKEDFAHDLNAIVSIVKEVLSTGVVTHFANDTLFDLNIVENKEALVSIFEHIGSLHILNNDSVKFVNFIYSMITPILGIEVEVTEYSFEEDFASIAEIVGLLVDILEANNLNTINDIMAFADYTSVISDDTFAILSDVLEVLPTIDFATNLLPQLVAKYTKDFFEGYDLAHLQSMTKEQIVEDLESILGVVRYILEFDGLAADIEKLVNEGTFTHFKVEVITIVETLLESVLDLNLLGGKLGEFVHFALDLVDMNPGGIDFDNIDQENEKEHLVGIFTSIREALESLNIVTVDDLFNFDYQTLTSEQVTYVAQVIEHVGSLTLLHTLAIPFASDMLVMEGTMGTLTDLAHLYGNDGSLLGDDIKAIADIVYAVADLGAVEFVLADGSIDFGSEAFGEIINAIFGLNYLNHVDANGVRNSTTVIYALAEMFNINAEGYGVEDLNFAEDGEALVELYYKYQAAFEANGLVFPIHKLSDLEDPELINKLSEYYLDSRNAALLVEMLDELLHIPSFNAVALIGGGFGLAILAEQTGLLESFGLGDLTAYDLVEDLFSVIEILRIAVDENKLNVLDIIKNMENSELSAGFYQGLVEVLEIVAELNILTNSSDVFEYVFTEMLAPSLGVDFTSVIFSKVNIKNVCELLINIINNVEVIANELDVNSMADINELMSNIDYAILENQTLVDALSNILLAIEETPLLNELAYPIAKTYAESIISSFGLSFDGYSKAEFNQDVDSLIEVVRNVMAFALGESIDFANEALVTEIFSGLFGLNFIRENEEAIFNKVNEILSGMSLDVTLDHNLIDLVHDAEVLGAFYGELAYFLASEEFPIKSITDIFEISLTLDTFAPVITSENAMQVVYAIEELLNLSILGAGLDGASSMIESIISGIMADLVDVIDFDQYLAYSNGNSKALDDVRALLDIVKNVILLGAVEVYNGKTIYVFQNNVIIPNAPEFIPNTKFDYNEQLVYDIFVKLFSLNILNDDSEALIKFALGMAGIEVPNNDYYDNYSFAADAENLAVIAEGIFGAIYELFGSFANSDQIMSFINNQEYMVGGNINSSLNFKGVATELITLISNLFDSRLLSELIIPAYYSFVGKNAPAGMEDLLSIDGLTTELIVEDIRSILGALQNAVDQDVIKYALGYINGEHVLINYDNDILKVLVETLLSLNVLEIKQDAIVGILPVEQFAGDYDIASHLDILADADDVAAFVDGLYRAITVRSDFIYKYTDDFADIDINKLANYVVQDEIIYDIINSFKEITDTTIMTVVYNIGANFADSIIKELSSNSYAIINTDLSTDSVEHDLNSIFDVLAHTIDVYGTDFISQVLFNNAGEIEIDVNKLALEAPVELVADLLVVIPTLHIIEGGLDDAIMLALEIAGMDATGVDLTNVDFVHEFETIGNALRQVITYVKALTNNSNPTLQNVLDVVDGLGLNNIAEKLDHKDLSIALEALNILLDLDLISKLAVPLYCNNFQDSIVSMLGIFGEFANLNNYSEDNKVVAELLVQDIKSVIAALQMLTDEVNVLGIAADFLNGSSTTLINYDNAAFNNLFVTLFSLEYLEKFDSAIVAVLNSFTEGLSSSIEFDDELLSLSQDAQVLADLISYVLENLVADVFPYASTFTNMPVDLVDQIINVVTANNDFVLGLIGQNGLLREFLDTTLVDFAINGVKGYIVELINTVVPQDLQPIINTSFTAEQLIHDVLIVLDIVEKAVVELGVNHVYTCVSNDIMGLNIHGIINTVTYVLPRLVEFEMINVSLGEAIVKVLAFMGFNTDGIDLSDVDYASELTIIANAIAKIGSAIPASVVSINDTLNWAKEYKFNDDSLVAVLEAFAEILSIQTLEKAIVPLYSNNFYGNLEGMLGSFAGFADLRTYSSAKALVEDVQSIIYAIRDVIATQDFNTTQIIVDFMNNTSVEAIDYDHATIKALIETLFGLNYLVDYEGEIYDLLDSMGYAKGITKENFIAQLDLAADGKVIADLVSYVLGTLVEPVLPYASMFKAMPADLVDQIINIATKDDSVALALVNGTDGYLRALFEMSIAKIGYQIGLTLADGLLESLFEGKLVGLVHTNLSPAEVIDDINSVLDIVEYAVENMGVNHIYTCATGDIMGLTVHGIIDTVQYALYTISGLNVIDGSIGGLIEFAISFAGLDATNVDLSQVDYSNEIADIVHAIERIQSVLPADQSHVRTSLEDVMNYFVNFNFNDDTLVAIIASVNDLIGLQTIEQALLPLYVDNFKATVTGMLGSYGELANLNNYSSAAALIDDVQSIFTAISNIIATPDFNTTQIIVDFMNDTSTQPIDYDHETIHAFIETLFSINYFKDFEVAIYDILNGMGYLEDVTVSEFMNEFNIEQDGKAFADLITYVLGTLVEPVLPYASSFKSMPTDLTDQIINIVTKDNSVVLALVNSVDGLIRAIFETSLAKVGYEIALPIVDEKLTSLLDGKLVGLVNTDITPDQVISDINVVLDIVEAAVNNLGVNHVYTSVKSDIKGLNIHGIIDTVVYALPRIAELNIIKANIGDLILVGLGMVGINTDGVDLSGVDYASELQIIANTIAKIGTAIPSDVVTIKETMDWAMNYEFNDDQLVIVVEAIAELLGLATIEKAIVPIYTNNFYGSLEGALGSFSAFADLRNYSSAAAMIDDVQSILYAVRDVIETPDFNTTQIIVDFMNNTSVEAIDYDHATIHALIETVFALNYLSDFEGVIYDTLDEMGYVNGITKEKFMFDLNLAADGKVFADLITYVLGTLVEPVLPYAPSFKAIPANLVDQIINIATKDDTVALALVNGTDGYLRAIIETSVAKLGYQIGLSLADGLLENVLDGKLVGLVHTNITPNQVISDINVVLDIVETAIHYLGVNHIYTCVANGKFMDLDAHGTIDTVVYALPRLAELNIIDASFADLILVGLEMVGLNTDGIDLSDVEYGTEFQVIADVIAKIGSALPIEVETIGEAIDWVKDYQFNDDQLVIIVEAIAELLSLETIEKLIVPLYINNFYDKVANMLGDFSAFADLRNYSSAAAIIDDIQSILYAVRDVIATPDFNTTQMIVDFMRNTSVEAIDYDHATIHALIETVFGLNYLSDFEGAMYDALVSKDLIKSSTRESRSLAKQASTLSKSQFMFELNIAADGKVFADLITYALATLVEPVLPYSSSFKSIPANLIDQIINIATADNTVALALVNSVDGLIRPIFETTLAKVGYQIGLPLVDEKLETLLDGKLVGLVHTDINTTLVVEDINTILNIVEIAVYELGVNHIYNTVKVNVMGLHTEGVISTAVYALKHVTDLNIIKDSFDDFIVVALKSANFNTSGFDLSVIDYANEFAIINDALIQVESLLRKYINKYDYTLQDVLDWAKGLMDSATTEFVVDAIEIVETLITLETLSTAIIPLYENNYEDKVSSQLGDLGGLAKLSYYNSTPLLTAGEVLVKDVADLLAAIKALATNMDVVGMYRDYANDTQTAPINFYDASISGLLETVFSLQYFADFEEPIYDLLVSKEFVNEMSLAQFESSFALAEDASALTDLIVYAIENIAANYFTYASDIKSNINSLKENLVNDVVAAEFINGLVGTNGVLRELADSATLRTAMMIGLDYVCDMVVNMLGETYRENVAYFDENGSFVLTADQVSHDYNAIFDMIVAINNIGLDNLIDMEKLTTEVKLIDLAEIAQTILPLVIELNILRGAENIGDFIYEFALEKGITLDKDQLTSFDYVGIINEIADMVVELAEVLAPEYTIISNLKDITSDVPMLVALGVVVAYIVVDHPELDFVVEGVYNFAYDKYIKGDNEFVNELANIAFYNDENISGTFGQDVRAILTEALETIEFALPYIEDETSTIDYDSLMIHVSELINVVFDTTFYSAKELMLVEKLVEVLDSKGIVLESTTAQDLAEILSLENDSEVLGNFLVEIAANVLANANFPYHTVSELKEININTIKDYVLNNQDVLVALAASLDSLAGLDKAVSNKAFSLLEVAYVIGIDYANKTLVDNFGTMFDGLLSTSNLTSEQVRSDFENIFDIVQLAVENNMVEVIMNNDYMSINLLTAEALLDAVYSVLAINAINEDLSGALEYVLVSQGIYVDQTMYNDLTLRTDITNIVPMVSSVINELVAEFGNITIARLKDKVNNYKDFIDQNIVVAALDLVSAVVNTSIVKVLGLDIYNSFDIKVSEDLAFLTDLSFYNSNEQLVRDVTTVLDTIRKVVSTTDICLIVTDMINKSGSTPLNADINDGIATIINVVLDTAYVANKDADLVMFALDKLSLAYDVNDINVDLANDKDIIADFVRTVLNVIINVEQCKYPYNFVSKNIEWKELLTEQLTDNDLITLVNAVSNLMDTTIAEVAAIIGYDMLSEKLPEIVKPFFNSDVTSRALADDVKELCKVAVKLIENGIVKDIVTPLINKEDVKAAVKELDINKYTSSIEALFDAVVKLYMLNIDSAKNYKDLLANKADITLSFNTFNKLLGVDFKADITAIKAVVLDLIADLADVLADEEGKLTINSVLDHVKAIKANELQKDELLVIVDALIKAVNAILDNTSSVNVVAIDVINHYTSGIDNNIVKDLLTIDESFGSDLLAEDIKALLNVVRNAIVTDLYQLAFEYKNFKTAKIMINEDASVELGQMIYDLVSLNLLSFDSNRKYVDLALYAFNKFNLDFLTDTDLELMNISLEGEATKLATLADTIIYVFNTLSNEEFKFDIPLLGNTELMANVINVYNVLVSLETFEVIATPLANDFLFPKAYSLSVSMKKPIDEFDTIWTREQVLDLFNDFGDVLDALMAMGVFSNNGIVLSDGYYTSEHIFTIHNFIFTRIDLGTTIESKLENIIENIYILGTIPMSYEGISLSSEKAAIKSIKNAITNLINVVKEYTDVKDYTGLFDTIVEAEVIAVYEEIFSSPLASQLLLPLINIAYLGFAEDNVFVLFDEADGVSIYTFVTDVIEPLFDAGRLFRNAIEIVDGGADFYIPYFDDIKAAIDVLFNTRWAQGHADELVKSAVLWSTKIRLSDDVDGETELEIIKSLVDDIKVIIDECVDGEFSTDNLLNRTTLFALSSALDKLADSTMFYEMKNWLISKSGSALDDTFKNMIVQMTSVQYRNDLPLAADALYNIALANIYNGTSMSFELGAGEFLATAIEKLFSMMSMEGHEADIYDMLMSELNIYEIDPGFDAIYYFNQAQLEEGWTWAEEIAQFARLIRSLDGILASTDKDGNAIQLTVDGQFKFENLANCSNVDALAETLKAFNQNRALRPLLLTIINEQLEGKNTADFNVDDYISDALRTQLSTNVMAAPEVWDSTQPGTPNECENIAKLLVALQNGISMPTEGDLTVEQIDSLMNILTIMNDSAFFQIGHIAVVLDDEMQHYTDHFSCSDAQNWTKQEWKEELPNIRELLVSMTPLTDHSAAGITELSEEQILNLLDAINNSNLVRDALPAIINDTAFELNSEAYLSTWLLNQVGGAAASKATWEVENVHLAKLIYVVNHNQDVFNRLNANTYTDSDVYVIKQVLIEMNDTQSFELSPVVEKMDNALINFLGNDTLVTLNGNITKDQWSNELDLIFGVYDASGNRTSEGIVTLMKFGTNDVSYEELRDNNNYGSMLDMMDDSAIFAGAVNQMVRELVQETSLYPSIIKPTDLTDAKLDEVRNSDGGWSGELAILTSVNPTADFQGGSIIDTLRQSIILGDRLPDFVWEVVVEKGLSTYISQADFLAAYNEVEYKIALGELTSDPADDYSWAQEVDTLIAFANEVENVKANPLNGVTTLISLASQSVIAGFMINNVINSL